VNLPKATTAAVAAVLVLALGGVRVAATRRVTIPLTPSLWAAAAAAVGLVVATVTSDVHGASFAGTHGRSDGLLLYGSCVVLFLTGLRVLDFGSVRWLLRTLLLGGAFAASYGLLQRAGIDPIGWSDSGISPVIGTFGNPDFESGYLGVALPAAAWGALTRSWSLGWRLASALVLVSSLLCAVLSSAVQGPLAGGAGLLVIAAGVLLGRGGHVARRGVIGLSVVAVAAAIAVASAVVTGAGPLAALIGQSSVTSRKWYWSSALSMWRQNPLVGVGLDRYGAHFRAVRPAAAAAVSNYSDAAHSVPLQFLGTGGLVLAVPYGALVLLVGLALVTGARRLEGEQRLLLAGVGGAWLAYQVQSVVSIDQPGLAVTHWLLAAGVVALGSPPRMYERLLPGAVVPIVRRGRREVAQQPPVAVWSGLNVALCLTVGAVALGAMWLVLLPLRADHAARLAAVDLVSGNGNASFEHIKTATRLAPYEQVFWLQRGKFLEQVKQPALAASAYAAGAENDPRAYDVLLAGAILAKAQNDLTALDRYSRRLAAVDPSDGWRTALGG
jgi:O-antigen ligase